MNYLTETRIQMYNIKQKIKRQYLNTYKIGHGTNKQKGNEKQT